MAKNYGLAGCVNIVVFDDGSALVEDARNATIGVDDARQLLRALQEHFGEADMEATPATPAEQPSALEARVTRLEEWAKAHAAADSALLPDIVESREREAYNAFGSATLLQHKANAFRQAQVAHEKFLADLGGEE